MIDPRPSNTDGKQPAHSVEYTPKWCVCAFESFEFFPNENRYRALYNRDRTETSTAVISAVGEAADTDPLDIEPLHNTVDTDALDALLSSHSARNGDRHVSFSYHGHDVTVSSYGTITVQSITN
jgi:hypothetical protein